MLPSIVITPDAELRRAGGAGGSTAVGSTEHDTAENGGCSFGGGSASADIALALFAGACVVHGVRRAGRRSR